MPLRQLADILPALTGEMAGSSSYSYLKEDNGKVNAKKESIGIV